MKQICYPRAYGSLDGRVACLVDEFRIKCNLNGIKYSKEQIELLESIVINMRDKAYEAGIGEWPEL